MDHTLKLTTKSVVTASAYGIIYKFLHGTGWKDTSLMRAVLGSLASAGIAELIMTSIVQRITELLNKNGNAGMIRIFDQGLNASIQYCQ